MSIFKNAPSDIQSFLTFDEKLLKTDNNNNWEIYLTNKRILLKRSDMFGSKEIVEASHRHISSIEYTKVNPFLSIIAGIICIIVAIGLNYILDQPIFNLGIPFLGIGVAAILVIIGVAVIILAFLKKPTFKLHIVGRNPITLSSKLEEIFRIVREHQEK